MSALSEILGCEAIAYQPNSQLMKDMTAAFQLGFDHRDSLRISDSIKNSKQERDYIANQICRYVRAKVIPAFITAVEKNTGLIITRVHLHTDLSVGPIGMFAVDVSLGNLQASNDTIDRITGVSKRPTLTEALKDYMMLSDNLDLKTGKLTKTTFGKAGNRKISCSMYFDVLMAYCPLDFIVHGGQIEPFTAGELAAIMCHEVGHILTLVERSGDWYFQYRRATSTLKNVKMELATNPKQIDDVLATATNIVATLAKTGDDKDKTKEALTKLLTGLQTTLNQYKRGDRAFDIIIDGMIVILAPVFYIFSSIVNFSLFLHLALVFLNQIGEDVALMQKGDKASDIYSSTQQLAYCERLADEFVSQHGASNLLALALNKLEQLFHMSYLYNKIDASKLRQSFLTAQYIKVYVGLLKLVLVDMEHSSLYEDHADRIKRLTQNAIAPLKDPKLPKDLRNEALRIYEETAQAATFAKRPNGLLNQVHQWILKTAYVTLTKVSPYTLLSDGNLREDYAKLSDQIDELQNNKFYYQSQKLNQLGDR